MRSRHFEVSNFKCRFPNCERFITVSYSSAPKTRLYYPLFAAYSISKSRYIDFRKSAALRCGGSLCEWMKRKIVKNDHESLIDLCARSIDPALAGLLSASHARIAKLRRLQFANGAFYSRVSEIITRRNSQMSRIHFRFLHLASCRLSGRLRTKQLEKKAIATYSSAKFSPIFAFVIPIN